MTVAADRCEQAEVAAKVAFVLGPARGGAFLGDHHLAGMLVDTRGAWASRGAWPAHLMRPAIR